MRIGETLLGVVAMVLAGCSLVRREQATPQQRFLEALNRGNAAEAVEIWRNMSPEQRAAWSHGQGLGPNPQAAREGVQRQIQRHMAEQAEGAAEETGQELGTPAGALPALPALMPSEQPTVPASPAASPPEEERR